MSSSLENQLKVIKVFCLISFFSIQQTQLSETVQLTRNFIDLFKDFRKTEISLEQWDTMKD